MFANFLYFITALLVLTLYEPAQVLPFSGSTALVLFLLMAMGFGLYTRSRFRKLQSRVARQSQVWLDQRFSFLQTHLAILALVLLGITVWILHLPAFVLRINWITHIPTLNDLIFLFVFISLLATVWYHAYPCHRDIYGTTITRREFVFSNIAFCIPLLIPWLLLSGITDLIQLLPFAWVKQILNTYWGQIGFFFVFLGIAAIFAPALVQRFWRCRPLPAGQARSRIENLCRKAGVGFADIVYWPIFGGRMVTAGVMGLVSRFRYILVTDALLRLLTPEEIDQVIAHEIGHVRRRHLQLYLLFFAGLMLVWHLAFMISQTLIFIAEPWFQSLGLISNTPSKIIAAGLLITTAFIYFRYIFGYFMRNFERQADLFVFRLFSSVHPLISTFSKIAATSGQPADKPNWHHFSIQQRIDYLRRSEQSPVWIGRHDSKVRKSIAVYLAALVVLGVFAVYYQRTYANEQSLLINLEQLESDLQSKAVPDPKDAPYYLLLGNVYLAKKDFQKAVSFYEKGIELNPTFQQRPEVVSRLATAYYETKAYDTSAKFWEKALALAPDNPDMLNNLAWLFATAQDENIKDPKRALDLAVQALEKQRAPHILDTYAEALYANGRYAEAVAAAEKAIGLGPEDLAYFQKQLDKFRKAAGKAEK